MTDFLPKNHVHSVGFVHQKRPYRVIHRFHDGRETLCLRADPPVVTNPLDSFDLLGGDDTLPMLDPSLVKAAQKALQESPADHD